MENNFKHKVNEETIPVCSIMGVNIALINMECLLKFTNENIKKLFRDYLCISSLDSKKNFLTNLRLRLLSNW